MLTMDQIIENENKARKEYEQNTKHNGFTVAELRKAFEAVQDKSNWKNPWQARVHHEKILITLVAVEFFHAATPTIGKDSYDPSDGTVEMTGCGYQAW